MSRRPMINGAGPADFLRSVEPGTRVVARHRVPGGFSDALGYLRTCDGDECEIDRVHIFEIDENVVNGTVGCHE